MTSLDLEHILHKNSNLDKEIQRWHAVFFLDLDHFYWRELLEEECIFVFYYLDMLFF